MTDNGSGGIPKSYILVEDNAELNLWTESLALPLGAKIALKPIGGSGHLEMTTTSAIVSLSE